MDTQTKTGENHRELTKTEIDLAAAQIKDRLYRLLNCKDAILKSWDSESHQDNLSEEELNILDQENERMFREKYDIPQDVNLYVGSCNTQWAKENIVQWIKPFAAGQLTEDLIEHEINGYAMDINEFDYHWVFLGIHGNVYDTKSGIDTEDGDREIIEIGSRSKIKSLACRRWQTWHDNVLQNSYIKDQWKERGYKYNLEMCKEDTKNLKNLYNKAKEISSKISNPYWNKVDAIRKEKHPLPKNWQKQIEDATELFLNNRDWQDYKKQQFHQ
jgi:hypothetical protein